MKHELYIYSPPDVYTFTIDEECIHRITRRETGNPISETMSFDELPDSIKDAFEEKLNDSSS